MVVLPEAGGEILCGVVAAGLVADAAPWDSRRRDIGIADRRGGVELENDSATFPPGLSSLEYVVLVCDWDWGGECLPVRRSSVNGGDPKTGISLATSRVLLENLARLVPLPVPETSLDCLLVFGMNVIPSSFSVSVSVAVVGYALGWRCSAWIAADSWDTLWSFSPSNCTILPCWC